MKVLHVIDSGGLYGAERMVLCLMDEQVKLGIDPVLGSVGHKGVEEKAIEAEAEHRGLAVIRFRMMNGPNLFGAMRILRSAQEGGCDLIHCHGYKGDILLGYLPRAIRKIPLVTTLHGWTNSRLWSRMTFYKWLDSGSLNHMDGVAVVDASMLAKIKPGAELLGKVRVINNGLPPHEPSGPNVARDDDMARFCRSGFIIGSIGRLSPEKNYRLLAEACRVVVDAGIDAKLVIIGEGPDRRELEALISRLNIRERSFLPGYRENARDYLSLFNAFVLSSVTEGLPISALEAMQAGIPIVASNVGGLSQLLENGRAGLLVSVGDKDNLSQAILRIHQEDELRRKLTGRAKEIVDTSYSSKAMARGYLELYESAMGKEAGRLRLGSQ